MWGAGQDKTGYRISSHGSGELATPASMGGGRTGSEVKAALAGPGSWLVRTGWDESRWKVPPSLLTPLPATQRDRQGWGAVRTVWWCPGPLSPGGIIFYPGENML